MVLGLNLLPALALVLSPGVSQGAPACPAPISNLTPPAQTRVAACGPYCDTAIRYVTDIMAGQGSSCAAALSDLTAQITAYATQQCRSSDGFPSCQVSVTAAPYCRMDAPGVYTQLGWGYYSCKETSC